MAGKSKGCREPQSHRCPSDEFWRKGDVVMWDNRATMHRGRPWPAHEARLMMRTTIYATEADGLETVRPPSQQAAE
jgi:alpha-ketoglutarate-dependent 2,4-dichlorophenoxyacetate dioxygenase